MSALPAEKGKRRGLGWWEIRKWVYSFISLFRLIPQWLPVPLSCSSKLTFLSLPFLGTPWQVAWCQGLTTDNAPEGSLRSLTQWTQDASQAPTHRLISSLPTKAVWVPVAPVLAGAICFPKVTVRLLDWKSYKTVNSLKTSLGMY